MSNFGTPPNSSKLVATNALPKGLSVASDVPQPSKIATTMLVVIVFSTFLLSYLPGGNLINRALGLLFGLVVLALMLRRKVRFPLELRLLLSWTLYGLAVSIFARDPSVALAKSLTMLQLAFLVFCALNVMLWSGRFRFFMWIYVAGMMGSYLTCLIPGFGLQFGSLQLGMSDTGRLSGTLVDANQFGIAMIQALFFLAYLLMASRNWKERILILAAFVFCFFGVAQSGSRSAGIAFMLLICLVGWAFRVYNFISHPKRLLLFLIGSATFAAIAFIVIQNSPEIMKRWVALKEVVASQNLSKERGMGSLKGRAYLARSAFDLAIKHPLGVGLDNFRLYHLGASPHSNHLGTLADTGFLGWLTYYLIYATMFLRAVRIPKVDSKSVTYRRLLMGFPLLIILIDFVHVSYYYKDLWLANCIVMSIVYRAYMNMPQQNFNNTS